MNSLMLKALIRTLFALAISFSDTFAQTLTTLHSCGDVSKQVGIRPSAPLLYGPDGLLYGSTSEAYGAGIARGALFKVRKDGTGLQIIKQFTNVLEGSSPQGRLQLEGNTLYGLTTRDGSNGGGTIFRVQTNGIGFAVLHSFPNGAFSTEALAIGGMTLSGSTLYGATPRGGKSNGGVIFRINTNGSDYTVIKEFSGKDGAQPLGDLVVSDSALFGTTFRSAQGDGVIFRVGIDGTNFRILKEFVPTLFEQEGAGPSGGLVLANGVLFGSNSVGGTHDSGYLGTIFEINTDGSGFQTLKLLEKRNPFESLGRAPVGTLVLEGDRLYGVTSFFSELAPGPRAFRINTNGTDFSVLDWPRASQIRAGLTVVDGVPFGTAYATDPIAYSVSSNALGHIFGGSSVLYTFVGNAGDGGVNSIVRSGEYFYGTTAFGGSKSAGTIFRVKTNGTDFSILFSFPSGADGERPGSRLAIEETNIFGLAHASEYRAVLYRVGIDGTKFEVLRRFNIDPEFSAPGERPAFLPAPVFFQGHVYATSHGFESGVFRIDADGSYYKLVTPLPVQELTLTKDAIFGLTLSNHVASIVRIGANDEVTAIREIKNVYVVFPQRLALVGQTLFGVITMQLGTAPQVFKCQTDGADFALLDFLPNEASRASLVTDGKVIYGLSEADSGTNGTIFQLSTNGTNPPVIYEFPAHRGNVRPDTELVIEGNRLFGSTYSGGDAGQGTVFALDLVPRLEVRLTDARIRLTWPEFAAGYRVETKTNLSVGNWLPGPLPSTSNFVELTNLSNAAFFRLSNQ